MRVGRKGEGEAEGEVEVGAIKKIVNDDNNLALTNKPLNASKWSHDLKEWEDKPKSGGNGESNADYFDVDTERSEAKDRKSVV